MAMISGARSGFSINAYSIPFSSQTMHTAHVYVDRGEPMITGLGMGRSALSSCDLRYAIEAASGYGVNPFRTNLETVERPSGSRPAVAGRRMTQPVYPQFRKYPRLPALALRANKRHCEDRNKRPPPTCPARDIADSLRPPTVP
jgi:hypothetical protein